MLNYNESMWRDSATSTSSMAKPTANAWALERIGQNPAVTNGQPQANKPPGGPPPPSAAEATGVPPGGSFKFVFSEDAAVLFGGPPQKIGGLEDAMERLSMVSTDH